MTPATLTFLGTADSKGVPRFWCACAVCYEARTTGHNRRTRTALLLRGPARTGAAGGTQETTLLDAGTDLHTQLARLGEALVPERVLVSHAHNDHILGLADLLDYARYEGGHLPMYAPADVIASLADRFGYAFRGPPPVQPLPEAGLTCAGLRVHLFPVPHGANGVSHAYHLERPGFRAAIVTDAIDVPSDVAARWLQGLDLLVLGTSFADESAAVHAGRSVYDVREALALPWAQAAGRVVLTHLSHDIDVSARELTEELPEGWQFAHDGLTVELA